MTSMVVSKQPKPKPNNQSTEDDLELQAELRQHVDKILNSDAKTMLASVDMLKFLIRTSTASMTSVPKPLKYLAPSYDLLKKKYETLDNKSPAKKHLADVISVLSLGVMSEDVKREYDCLRYCIIGTQDEIGSWGHEYVRQLETELVNQWVRCDSTFNSLIPLVKKIVFFDCLNHDEIQASDLLMEINQLDLLANYLTVDNFGNICRYLNAVARYTDELERTKILRFVSEVYFRFGDFCSALICALIVDDQDIVDKLFAVCKRKVSLYQMAFICARNSYPVNLNTEYDEEIANILDNAHLSNFFNTFGRELDILEPKSPEDVYKTWLEPANFRGIILGEKLDSARQNLASSIVNGFVNAGFGSDKLLSGDDGNKWIYRNKEQGMMSATAALGLIHLWDVDGGLTPIDKYLYATDPYVKAGALLALGIVNCRVKNECDPALALLGDYIGNPNEEIDTAAILGLGIAYAGTARTDVLDLLEKVLNQAKTPKILGMGSLAAGLVCLGRNNSKIVDLILTKLLESKELEVLKSPYMLLACLGVGLAYMGAKDDVEMPSTTGEVFDEPFRTIFQTILEMCAYVGTGDVLIIHEMLKVIEGVDELSEAGIAALNNKTPEDCAKDKKNSKLHWDYDLVKALAVLAISSVTIGEDLGTEMLNRIQGHISRYGEPTVRKAVPLSIALSSASDPKPEIVNILTKYSHDFDEDVACNAIFGLGFVGAGTNNARLAATLRQLALYHAKNAFPLFMVRIAQGLVHLGKGTMTLSPLNTDRQLIDPVAMAGILITMLSLIKPHNFILGRSHYLLYMLTCAIHPRWLLTLDEELNPLQVSVRVGQAVDIVGKAGYPKTISGIHTHATPVLLTSKERAELATREYYCCNPVLDGICVLSKVPED